MPFHRMSKIKIYPKPHNMKHKWIHSLEPATVKQYTIYPIIMYDEGLGSSRAYDANPLNTNFAESNAPNCFPESKVDNIFCELQVNLTKFALETDKLTNVRGCFMPIMMSFKEDYLAIDDKTSSEIQDILELEFETTDRQGFPLWNAVDMEAPHTSSDLLDALVPGLT